MAGIDNSLANQLGNAQLFHDISSLDSIRQNAKSDDKAALRQAAEQFESMFWSEVLKSMRKAEDVLAADSPMNSQSTKFFRDMQDQQMAVELSSQGALGLADLLVAQFDPKGSSLQPPSMLSRDSLQRQTVNRPDKLEGVAKAADPLEPPAALSGKLPPVEPANFESPEAFISRLLPYAESAAKQLGVEPEVLVAQAALETGWGNKVIKAEDGNSSYNLFNIKADRRWDGDAVRVGTLEYKQGVPVMEKAAFRRYQDFAQSFSDYVDFIKSNGRYSEALKAAGDAIDYVRELQQAGYATDPNYADKIISVMGSIKSHLGQSR